MAIDLTVNLGHIITIATVALGGLFFVWQMKGRVDLLADRLERIDEHIDKLKEATLQIARQDERLLAMDRRLQELSNRLSRVAYGRDDENSGESGRRQARARE
jgi:hypothetical protein